MAHNPLAGLNSLKSNKKTKLNITKKTEGLLIKDRSLSQAPLMQMV